MRRGDEVVLACAKQRKTEKKKNKQNTSKSLAKYTAIFVSVICIVTAFIFNSSMVFSAESLLLNGYVPGQNYLRSASSTFISKISDSAEDIPGVNGSITGSISGSGTGQSQFNEYDVYTYNEDLYKEFVSGPIHDWILSFAGKTINDNAAKILSAILTYCMQKPEMGFNFGLGVIANALDESAGIPGSMDNHGRYVKTLADIEEIEAHGHSGNRVGYGILQWTWYTYLPVYGSVLRMYCHNGVLSDDDIRAADMHYMLEYAFPEALSRGLDLSTPYKAGWSFHEKYEKSAYYSENGKRASIADGLASLLQKYNK